MEINENFTILSLRKVWIYNIMKEDYSKVW